MAVDTTLVVQVTETGLTDKSFFTHNLNKVVRLAQVADRGKTLFYNEKYSALKMLHSRSLLFANSVDFPDISKPHVKEVMGDIKIVKIDERTSFKYIRFR